MARRPRRRMRRGGPGRRRFARGGSSRRRFAQGGAMRRPGPPGPPMPPLPGPPGGGTIGPKGETPGPGATAHASPGFWKDRMHSLGRDNVECFIPEAKVLMADGTQKQIKDVIVGDLVQGKHGVNVVKETPTFKIGNQPLHGFNDIEPFMTSMHPILTDHGWGNFNPELYEKHWPKEYSEISVDNPIPNSIAPTDLVKITEGDQIGFWNADDSGIIFKPMSNYKEKEKEPDFQVHNLVLDNDHSMIVEGVVAHNKGGGPPPGTQWYYHDSNCTNYTGWGGWWDDADCWCQCESNTGQVSTYGDVGNCTDLGTDDDVYCQSLCINKCNSL